MKKSIFLCCIFLLTLLTQAGTAHAEQSDGTALFIFGAAKWVAILGVAAIFVLTIRLIVFLFTKAKEKTGESFSRAREVFKEKTEDVFKKPELQYYGLAEQEINDEAVDQGLWAKALVNAKGNEEKRKSEYIKLRAIQLQKTVKQEEEKIAEQQRLVEQQQRIAEIQKRKDPISTYHSMPCPQCGTELNVFATLCPKCKTTFPR